MRRTLLRTVAVAGALLLGFACDSPTPVAPESATLTIAADPLRIDPFGTSEITVIGRKADGSPLNEGTEIILTTTLGSIDRLVMVDDRGVATAQLVGDGGIGVATVEASSGAAMPVAVEVQIGGLPALLTLAANPTVLPKEVPAEGATVSLSAAVQDDNGVAVNGALVTFVADIGSLASRSAPVATDIQGVALDELLVTRAELATVSDGFFTITASTVGEEGVLVEDFVDITVSGFPLNISLQAIPTSVPETGGTVDLNAIVLDDAGDPAPGAVVIFSTQVGSLASGGGSTRTDEQGVARDQLVVTAGDLDITGVSFTVTAETPGAGGILISDTVTVTIQRGAPTAIISPTVTRVDPTNPPADTSLIFTSESAGDKPISLTWDFGDGSPLVTDTQTGATRTVIHDYGTTTGTFTIKLTAENNLGTSEATLTIDLATIFPP